MVNYPEYTLSYTPVFKVPQSCGSVTLWQCEGVNVLRRECSLSPLVFSPGSPGPTVESSSSLQHKATFNSTRWQVLIFMVLQYHENRRENVPGIDNKVVKRQIPTFYRGLVLQFERLYLLTVTHLLVLPLRFLMAYQLLHLNNVKTVRKKTKSSLWKCTLLSLLSEHLKKI